MLKFTLYDYESEKYANFANHQKKRNFMRNNEDKNANIDGIPI
jgi:hypothetical protein